MIHVICDMQGCHAGLHLPRPVHACAPHQALPHACSSCPTAACLQAYVDPGIRHVPALIITFVLKVGPGRGLRWRFRSRSMPAAWRAHHRVKGWCKRTHMQRTGQRARNASASPLLSALWPWLMQLLCCTSSLHPAPASGRPPPHTPLPADPCALHLRDRQEALCDHL